MFDLCFGIWNFISDEFQSLKFVTPTKARLEVINEDQNQAGTSFLNNIHYLCNKKHNEYIAHSSDQPKSSGTFA